jgi:putative oxidoreductase
MNNFFAQKTSVILLIARVVLGIIFLAHGLDKFNVGVNTVGLQFEKIGIPLPVLMAWVVTLVETIGGIGLIVGIGSRIAAILLSIIMVVGIITVKLKIGLLSKTVPGYELNLALIVALLFPMIYGPGKYSLASLWMRVQEINKKTF